MRRSSTNSRSSLSAVRVRPSGPSSTRSNSRDRYSVDHTDRLSVSGRTPLQQKNKFGYGGNKSSRASSVYNRGKSDSVKDPRHLSDRSYRDRNIRRLIEFLSEHGYPNKLSVKILQSPSTRDFLTLYEFLVKMIDGKFRLDTKHEEQIPRHLKSFNYPFTITKNQLFTVGAPHVWPHLFGALIWLMEHIQYSCHADPMSMMYSGGNDFDQDTQRLYKHEYFKATYVSYMSGKDDFDEEYEVYRKKLESLDEESPVSLKSLQAENMSLKQEFEMLENEPDRLEYLSSTRTKYHAELKQEENHTEEVNRRVFELDKEIRDQHAKKQSTEMELERISNERNQMQKIYDTQDLTQEEVKRINKSREDLSRQIRCVEDEVIETEKRKGTLEMQIGKLQEKVEKVYNSLNDMFTKVKVAAPTTEHMILEELRLETKNASEAKHKLRQLLDKEADTVLKLRSLKLAEYQRMEELREGLNDGEEESKTLQNKNDRLKEEIERRKAANTEEYNNLQSEIDYIEKELGELRMMKYGDNNLRLLCADKERQLQSKLAEEEKRESMWQEFLTNVTHIVLSHKAEMEGDFARLSAVVKKHHEEALTSANRVKEFIEELNKS